MIHYFQNFLYLLAAVFFIVGIKRLSAVRTARHGNFLASFGMFLAVFSSLLSRLDYELILSGILIGSSIGIFFARKVKMTAMPQAVAILNGFGGISSLLVASAEFLRNPRVELDTSISVGISVLIGGITFTGSLIAFGKLQGIVRERSVIFPGQHILNVIFFFISICLIGLICLDYKEMEALFGFFGLGQEALPANQIILTLIIFSLLLGILSVIPIGGADMPVVISLLNSYSGIAAAMTGFALNNHILIITGALVGASGMILTRIMCVSMNRSLMNVLLGGFGTKSQKSSSDAKEIVIKQISSEEAAMMFDTANSVVIVPGYGMAVAQAQHSVRELSEFLEKKGSSVKFAIHPVAGRMPGHMNVLLAEANIPYTQLYEMDAINDEFPNVDIALVIGANDVTNPAARNDTSSPIYGMPILNVDKARSVIVIKRSLNHGYAGIDNELYGHDNCLMYLGDAKEAVSKLVSELKIYA